MTQRILVWDIPTRVFHWLLAASFAGAFLTAESERLRDIHVMLGYGFAGLIAFRLIWGLVGSRYARFRSFLFSPKEVVAYLRSMFSRSPRHYLGHNPVGSIAVFLLLGLGIVTALTGWMNFNDIGGEWTEEVHEGAANGMLALVVVHIVGVLVSSFLHRENLVRAMFTGRKDGEPQQAIGRGYAWVAALLIAGMAALWVWYPVNDNPVSSARISQEHDEDG